jgi:hypothetical protein
VVQDLRWERLRPKTLRKRGVSFHDGHQSTFAPHAPARTMRIAPRVFSMVPFLPDWQMRRRIDLAISGDAVCKSHSIIADSSRRT